MKRVFFVSIITLLFSCKKTETNNYLPLHNKKVLILGNSITQDGRYIDLIEYYLRKNYPKELLDIISVGLSSETVSGDSEPNHPFPRPWVHNRLDNALNKIKPDLVLACYGMNDGIYSDFDSIRFNNYKTGVLKLKEKVEATNANIIFLTPTPFDASTKKVYDSLESYSYKQQYAKYNSVLKTYSDWVKTIKNIQTIDLHSFVDAELKTLKSKFPDSTFIPDGIHPNIIGHHYMSKKILADLYPEIEIKAPLVEINQLKKDTLFHLVSKRRHIRSDAWLRYIGYERETIVKTDNITPTINKVKAFDKLIDELLYTH